VTVNEIEFEVVRDTEALAALRSDWERLWSGSASELYPLSYQAVWLAWTHCHQPKRHRLHVVVGRADGRVVLFWPILIRHERTAKLWRVAVWLGRDPIDYGDILVENTADKGAWVTAAFRHLVATVNVDVINLQAVRPDANAFSVLNEQCQHRIVAETAPYIDLRKAGNWQSYEAALPKSFRKGLQRRARRLEEVGSIDFLLTREPDLIEETVQWITDRKREWIDHQSIDKGLGLTPDVVEATVGLLRVGGQSGKILIARLTIDGTVIAADISQISDGRLYSDIGSFDLAWAKYSPGSLLMRETIKWAFVNDVAVFDFARGSDEYKHKWADQTVDLTQYIHPCGLLGRVYGFLRRINLRS